MPKNQSLQRTSKTSLKGLESYNQYMELLNNLSVFISKSLAIIKVNKANNAQKNVKIAQTPAINTEILDTITQHLEKTEIPALSEFSEKLKMSQGEEERIKILKDCLIYAKVYSSLCEEETTKCVFLQDSQEKKDFEEFLKNADLNNLLKLRNKFPSLFRNEVISRENFYDEFSQNIRRVLEAENFTSMNSQEKVLFIRNRFGAYALPYDLTHKNDQKITIGSKTEKEYNDILLKIAIKYIIKPYVDPFFINSKIKKESNVFSVFPHQDTIVHYGEMNGSKKQIDTVNFRREKIQQEKEYREYITIIQKNLHFLETLLNKEEVCFYNSLPGGLEDLSSSILQMRFSNKGETIQYYLLAAANPKNQRQQTGRELIKLLQPILKKTKESHKFIISQISEFKLTNKESKVFQEDFEKPNLKSLIEFCTLSPTCYQNVTELYSQFLEDLRKNLKHELGDICDPIDNIKDALKDFFRNNIGDLMMKKLFGPEKENIILDKITKQLKNPDNLDEVVNFLINGFDNIFDGISNAKFRDYVKEFNLKALEEIQREDPEYYQNRAKSYTNLRQELKNNFLKQLESEEFKTKDFSSKIVFFEEIIGSKIMYKISQTEDNFTNFKTFLKKIENPEERNETIDFVLNSFSEMTYLGKFREYIEKGNLKELMEFCKDNLNYCREQIMSYDDFYQDLKNNLAKSLQSDKFKGKNLEEKITFLKENIGEEIMQKLFKTKDDEPDFEGFCKKFEHSKDQDNIFTSLINAIFEKLAAWQVISPRVHNTSKNKMISNLVELSEITTPSKNINNSNKGKKIEKNL